MNEAMRQQLENISWKKLSREERGKILYKSTRIVQTPKGFWRVTSQTNPTRQYKVTFNGHKPKCECPDCTMRRKKCKHIWAVEFYLKQRIDEEGRVKETTKGVKITYAQKWRAYDKSQTNEKIIFMKLLRDLADTTKQPEYKFGRPTLPLSDMIFSSAMKIYSTFSLRRFMSDVKIAKEMKLIDKVPCYASVGHFLQREDMTDILKELIEISSLPLKDVETDFSVDASGFSTSRFARWFDNKYGRERKYRIWIKANLISGVKTNIVTGVEITEGEVHDSPSLPNLVEQTAKNFKVGEVSGDKAYSSRKNLQLIADVGAVPFIPFKKNVNSHRATKSIWGKMYHYFLYKNEEFMKHYNKRSNAETVFHMIKTKFRDNLRSKSKTAQINELLCKILCHNICVVIQEMNELGIRGEFVVENFN